MNDQRKQGQDEGRIERDPKRPYENKPNDPSKGKSSPNWPNTAGRVAGILGRK